MMIKASGRSALILATGLFVCFAGPSPTMAAGADTVAKSDGASAAKSAKPTTRHWKRSVQRKSGKVASKPAETSKDVADAAGDTPMPASVANANAQLAAADAPDSANAMTAKANTILLAAGERPADAQAPADAQVVVSSDQLNDVDRALQQTPSTQTVAMAEAKPTPAAPVLASSSDNSAWDQTSLIGKVFIAFGALLTMASAARMFMA